MKKPPRRFGLTQADRDLGAWECCGFMHIPDLKVCPICKCGKGDWRPADTAPKDGTHILACNGSYHQHWTFNQSPPAVVHYWSNPGEEGFYLSNGLVEGSYNDAPFQFTRWRPLGAEPQ